MNKRLLFTALVSMFVMPALFAEKTPQSELDILSAEADEAATEQTQSAPAITEPGVEATSDAETDKLSDVVTSQLSKILGESSGDTIDADTEDKIEKVISSSLLSGADMDDIKNAVSSAMTDLKAEGGEEISDEKIANATKSIDKLVGSETKTDEAADSYLSSLRAEADDVNEAAVKETPSVSQEKVEPSKVVTAEAKPEKVIAEEKTKSTSALVADKAVAEDTKKSFLKAESVTVLKGESLYKIALRVYGNGAMYARLYEANKDTIVDPNLINVGQVLKVPR